MQVALYARVSTPTQQQSDTIESQLDMLQTYAQQHGYEILPEHRFLDNGVSGAQLARPELERLRDGVQMGEIDAVLMLSPDRLARSYAHQWALITGSATSLPRGSRTMRHAHRIEVETQGRPHHP